MPTLEQRIHLAVQRGPDACIALAAELAASLPLTPPAKRRVAPEVTPAAPLAQLYRSVETDGAIGAQNRVLALAELWLEEDVLVFAEENQGVCEWGCASVGEDPEVLVRFPPHSWLPEGLALSAFLLRFLVFEVLMSARVAESAPCLPTIARDRLIADMRPLPFAAAPWPDDPSRFHARGDALCFECPNGDGLHSVWVGGATSEDLAFLRPHLGVAWD
jgi:hypothetical protein